MVKRFKFQDVLPKEFSNYNEREVIWLWHYLIDMNRKLNNQSFGCVHVMAEDISKNITYINDDFIVKLENSKNFVMLAEEEVSLIRNSDSRLASWLFHKLNSLSFIFRDEWLGGRLTENNSILAALDCDKRSLSQKRAFLSQLRAEWSENLKLDVSYRWIDENKNDEEFGIWLLKSGKEAIRSEVVKGGVNNPLDPESRVLKFKCMMDQWDQPEIVKRGVIDKLKLRWRSRGRTKSKGRIQFNVLVRPETKDDIKVLQGWYKLKSGGEVLDKLVKEAKIKDFL